MSTNTITLTPAALKAIIASAIAEAQAQSSAPTQEASPAADAKAAEKAAKAEKSAKFVAWMRESAPERKAAKAERAELAAWMRSKGLHPGGSAWEAAKAGERGVAKLRKMNAADKAARAAAKA